MLTKRNAVLFLIILSNCSLPRLEIKNARIKDINIKKTELNLYLHITYKGMFPFQIGDTKYSLTINNTKLGEGRYKPFFKMYPPVDTTVTVAGTIYHKQIFLSLLEIIAKGKAHYLINAEPSIKILFFKTKIKLKDEGELKNIIFPEKTNP